MSRDEAKATEVAVAKLAAKLAADPRLRAEVQRARREFFGASARADEDRAAAVPGAASAAEHRFAEWFALERGCDTLGDVPVELPAYGEFADELMGSLAGVFLVQDAIGGAVSARDLQDDTVLDLMVPPQSLREGDLLVGRLFPSGPGTYTPSTACAVFRPGVELGRAFARDLQRLELDRRLQQVELEHLLLRRPEQTQSPTAALAAAVPVAGAPAAEAPPTVPLEHLEADLEGLLREAGSELSAATISQQLALVARPGQVIGPLLDEMAFDSDVDLDRLRDLLLQIWNAHHAEADDAASAVDGAVPGAAPGETLGERLVRTLDEGLAQKRDVADLFAQLERMAGIEPEPEDAEDVADPADSGEDADDDAFDGDGGDDEELGDEDADGERSPGQAGRAAATRGAAARRSDVDEADEATFGDPDAGDLEPLVEEYLWESGRTDAETPLRLWTELQRNAPLPRVDLEQVTAGDLMRLLLHVYLGAAPARRAAAVQDAFAELRRFYDWAASTQELDFRSVLTHCQGSLLTQLDRLHAASQALSNEQRPASRPGILQVEDVGPTGFGVRDDDGGTHWIATTQAVAAQLQVGDLVLGALAPSRSGGSQRTLQGLVVVLPEQARELME
jgi:hypothetical protein